MTDFRVSCTVRFANGAPAPNIDVTVAESGHEDYRPGRTGPDGRIDAFLRKKRRIRILFWDVDDAFDNPRFTLTFDGGSGRRFRAGDASAVTLPDYFGPDEAAAVPTLVAGSPALAADAKIAPLIGANAPGYAYMVRRDGSPWLDVSRGLSVVASPTERARAMSRHTILHLASMSKSIAAAALAGMLDDWTALTASVAQIDDGTAPSTTLVLVRRFLFWRRRRTITVPTVLAPLFFSDEAANFWTQGLLARLPAGVRDDLNSVITGQWSVESAPVAAMPGYVGLMRRALRGDKAPAFDSPFLPLIRDRLVAGAKIGADMDSVTLSDLLCHRTNLASYDWTKVPAWEAAQVQPSEPADGSLAVCDYWGQTRLLLRRDAVVGGNTYLNENFVILTTVIEACTEELYDNYVKRRLFFDPRFAHIRRHVADPGKGARYYSGVPWTGGELLPDYSGWPASGGHYASVSQLTDWLHVLYSREPVAGAAGGTAPLISAAAHDQLFTTGALFSAGNFDRPSATTLGYSKNGGAGPNGGKVNGKMGIYVSGSGAVYTIALVMNGSPGADPPFDTTVGELAGKSFWT
jgi:CubicO group peptidase (beta-lactamase class C family)